MYIKVEGFHEQAPARGDCKTCAVHHAARCVCRFMSKPRREGTARQKGSESRPGAILSFMSKPRREGTARCYLPAAGWPRKRFMSKPRREGTARVRDTRDLLKRCRSFMSKPRREGTARGRRDEGFCAGEGVS